MRAFREHKGIVAPLNRANIDTDQIIPKQFLARIERTGYGDFLFYDWRYTSDGKPRPEFVLNQPRYASASILVTGKNFGCGSSREHAAWALDNFGIRAVIAPSFADIFTTNAQNNGILLITLSEEQVAAVARRAEELSAYELQISLQTKTILDELGFQTSFEIDEFRRTCLLEGLDEIGLTLKHDAEISAFENSRG
jgi:3-isopropylmalate/(R)-2-methylmalate dehydratase small subunit